MKAEGFYLKVWQSTWSIPAIAVRCDDSSLCVSSNENEGLKSGILSASEGLSKNSQRIYRKAKRSSSIRQKHLKIIRKLNRNNRKLFEKNRALLEEIPDIVSRCSQ